MKQSILLTFILLLGFISSKSQENKINVGVFNGNGASAVCILETCEALKIDNGINYQVVSASQIQDGILDKIDVLIFPGGSGSKELNNLGDIGNEIIQRYVKEQGKGILGICAGSYLLSSTPSYPSLKMSTAKNIDREHYNRGRGLVEFSLTKQGNSIFPELVGKKLFLQYYDGPVLQPVDSTNKKYTELAVFVTDIHSNKGIPSGITPDKTFLLSESIGKGKIALISGHPESTPGMRWIVPRLVRHITNNKLITYDKWIRPELNDSAILFTSDLKKYEKENFWKLLSKNEKEQITAMNNLYKIRSRPAVRWNIGLLRNNNPIIRKHAAYLLMQTEYTNALPDIVSANKNEKNKEVKKQFSETIRFLKTK